MVTNEWLILDGEPVEKLAAVLNQPKNSIASLGGKLQQLREFSKNLGQLDANLSFKGNITIQGDKEIPFEILKKIMFTCGQVGFNNMHLAVNQEEQI